MLNNYTQCSLKKPQQLCFDKRWDSCLGESPGGVIEGECD